MLGMESICLILVSVFVFFWLCSFQFCCFLFHINSLRFWFCLNAVIGWQLDIFFRDSLIASKFFQNFTTAQFKKCSYPKHNPIFAANPGGIHENNENSVKPSYAQVTAHAPFEIPSLTNSKSTPKNSSVHKRLKLSSPCNSLCKQGIPLLISSYRKNNSKTYICWQRKHNFKKT